MKKILAVLALAAMSISPAFGDEITVIETNTVGALEYISRWTYDVNLTSRSATLMRATGLAGNVTLANLLTINSELFTVTRVADGACADNYALLSVEIPNTILEVGAGVFANCTALAEVTLAYGIRYIGERTFINTAVREINVPDSLLDMGGNISAGTLFTSTINIDDSSHFKYSEDGVLYNRDMTKLYACPTRAEGTVTIPNTVTNIAADAFFGCHRITCLNIPKSLITIGHRAFNVSGIWPGLKAPESTPKLQSIFYNGSIPNAEDDIYAGTPANIVSYAFDDSWSGLEIWKNRRVVMTNPRTPIPFTDSNELTWYFCINSGVAEIWNNGTTAVTSTKPILNTLTLPQSLCGYIVKGIGDGALSNLRGITSISIPNTYEWIGAYACSNCTSLESISIPYGVRYIGERAFVNTIIREIALPDSLLDMGGNISAGTLFTSTINIDDSSHFKYSENGVLYNRDMTKLYACPTRAEGTVTIPNTVTNIATDAFFGCHRLSYLNLPATVNTIGEGAFNVAGIWPGLSAPESTPKLLSMFYNGPVPDAADDIYAGAPTDLVNYALDESWSGITTWKDREVKAIDAANPPILSYTDDTTGITWYYRIVNGMAEIFNDGNTAISPKSTPGQPFHLTEEAQNWSALWVLQVPSSINGFTVTKIGDYAFDGCNNLTRVGIPSSVESIGKYAFRGCGAVKAISDDQGVLFTENIELPTGVAFLGYHPFEGIKVSSVSLPYTLSELDGNPIAGCAYVTSLSVDSSCPSFYSENNILYNKRKSTVIAVPANYDSSSVSFLSSVTTIGDEALLGCKNISKIQVPDSLDTIGSSAFSGCESVKALSMPGTLASIGETAFFGCTSLMTVTYAGDAPNAANDIYEGTSESLTSYAYETASGFTAEKWKNRDIVIVSTGKDPGSDDKLSQTISGVTWYFRVVDDVAEIWRDDTTAVSSAEPLMSVTLPSSLGGYVVKGIGNGALSNMRGITMISIPPTYEWIGDFAFSNCTSLASVSIGNSVSSIGKSPFFQTALTTLEIPLGVAEIDGNPAAGCTRMQSIAVAEENTSFASSDGALYDKDFTTLLAVPSTMETVSIPKSATASADDAFAGCSRLKSLSQKLNEVTWTFTIENNKAVVAGISGETETITVPEKLIGYEIAKIDPEVMNDLSEVKKYESLSKTYVAKNGCLYSSDGKTLVRVPDSIVLPHTIKDTTTKETIEVTIVPGIKSSGDEGNDNTKITTNITHSTSSSSGKTTSVPGDIKTEVLLKGVTRIEDYAFYGCNVFDETPSVETNTLDGATGFDKSGNAYVTTRSCITTSKKEYSTVIEVGENVSLGANATKGSGVKIKRGDNNGNDGSDQALSPRRPESNANYIVSILSDAGDVIGSATVKVGKTIDKVTATVSTIGESAGKKVVKSLEELEKYGEVLYFMDVSKSDKTAFDKFKGKCWTLALAPAEVTHPLLGGYTALSVSVKSKGKVQIKGTAADGTKISASAQMAKDGDTFKIPVTVRMYSRKRGGFSTVFTVKEDALEIENGTVNFTAVVDGEQIVSPLELIASALRGDAEFESLRIWGHEDEYELGSDQKMPRYTKSTGLIKGKLTLYRKSDGKRVKANVNGVAVDGIGYGSAVMKNTASWPVELR